MKFLFILTFFIGFSGFVKVALGLSLLFVAIDFFREGFNVENVVLNFAYLGIFYLIFFVALAPIS